MYEPALDRGEAHPGPFRAGPNAPTGARGDRGGFPTDQGFPNQRASWRIVQHGPVPFRGICRKCLMDCPGKWARLYFTSKNSRARWNFLRLTKTMWNVCGMGIVRQNTTLLLILNSFCGSS